MKWDRQNTTPRTCWASAGPRPCLDKDFNQAEAGAKQGMNSDALWTQYVVLLAIAAWLLHIALWHEDLTINIIDKDLRIIFSSKVNLCSMEQHAAIDGPHHHLALFQVRHLDLYCSTPYINCSQKDVVVHQGKTASGSLQALLKACTRPSPRFCAWASSLGTTVALRNFFFSWFQPPVPHSSSLKDAHRLGSAAFQCAPGGSVNQYSASSMLMSSSKIASSKVFSTLRCKGPSSGCGICI